MRSTRPERPTRVALLGLACTLALAGGACGSDPDLTVGRGALPKPVVVQLRSLSFSPALVRVPVGGSVTWSWGTGVVPHNVVGPGFESPSQASGSFSHVFAKAGTVRYVCRIHPSMTGAVIVTADPGRMSPG